MLNMQIFRYLLHERERVARFLNELNVDSTILSLSAVSEVDLCQKTLFTTLF